MSIDYIKVVINYNNESYTMEVQKFKKLNYVKERVYKLFYPIKTDIDLKYNNKSLSSLLDQPIGMIFNEKYFIRLFVFPLPGVNKSMKIKSKNNKNNIKNLKLNINNDITKINNNNYLISSNRKEFNNNKEIKYNNKSAEKAKTENVNEYFNNNSNSLKLRQNRKKILPPIKTERNKKLDSIDYNNCNECMKNITSEYCRQCNKFLCLNCANKNHLKKGHKLIEIDNNEKINISRYKEEINKDLYDSLKSFDFINFEEKNNINDIEKYQKNFDTIIKSVTDVANGIKENLNEENNIEFNNEENKEQILNKINNIRDEIDNEFKKDNNIGINSFIELNEKDRKINKYVKEYKCNTNTEFINTKIQNLFLDVENEIDKLIFKLEENINIGQINEK